MFQIKKLWSFEMNLVGCCAIETNKGKLHHPDERRPGTGEL
jgi:translation initiation factor 6 (eIF-6)